MDEGREENHKLIIYYSRFSRQAVKKEAATSRDISDYHVISGGYKTPVAAQQCPLPPRYYRRHTTSQTCSPRPPPSLNPQSHPRPPPLHLHSPITTHIHSHHPRNARSSNFTDRLDDLAAFLLLPFPATHSFWGPTVRQIEPNQRGGPTGLPLTRGNVWTHFIRSLSLGLTIIPNPSFIPGTGF